MKVNTKKILKYTLMPQVMPRIRSLFFSGFNNVAFFMAQIYRIVRLLPHDHPYLNPENIGRFGVRHVIAEAAGNLSFRKENIDQIFVFALMLIGMTILVLQLVILMGSGMIAASHAGLYATSGPTVLTGNPNWQFFSYFQTPAAHHDLAFILLDRVFGLMGLSAAPNTSFFADSGGGYSCVVTATAANKGCFTGIATVNSTRTFTPDRLFYSGVAGGPGNSVIPTAATVINFPFPYHIALQGLLGIYSVGMIVIAMIIFLYFMFAVFAETAETGTAFGKRFNHLWAPIRIVFAMGLLIPIAQGLNPAQWMLMYAAKWGSSFATNGWILYNNAIAGEDTLLGPKTQVVATPSTPPINSLMEFGSILATCKIGYERLYHQRNIPGVGNRPAINIDAWLVNAANTGAASSQLLGNNFNQAYNFFDGGTFSIVFGERTTGAAGAASHQQYPGDIIPVCGEITLDMTYAPDTLTGTMSEPGSYTILNAYYDLIRAMWNDVLASGAGGVNGLPGAGGVTLNFYDIGEAMADRHIAIKGPANNTGTTLTNLPPAQDLRNLQQAYESFVANRVAQAVIDQQNSPEWAERFTELGWGGASIWYNKLAQLNGGLVSAAFSMPVVRHYPMVMEEVRRQAAGSDSTQGSETVFRNTRATDDYMPLDDDVEQQLADAMSQARMIWNDNYNDGGRDSNIIIDAIISIFGLEGLYSITSNDANNIHPLAQLTAIGRTIIDSAIRNLGYSFGSNVGAIFMSHPINMFGKTASGFFFDVAMIGLSIGFVLFYVIPFLPFIYFFFAVGGWIKSIFEGLVGIPLWALAHIRIDGKSLPSDAAMGGYYLILEIFLRPILILFGFIASISIFTAQVQILNQTWSLVTSNVTAFDTNTTTIPAGQTGSIEYLRGTVDEFFYTLIYAILCYMLAMASFKLVDQIPNHILRWMGANVQSFGDQNTDPAQNLVRNSYLGSNMLLGDIKQSVQGMGGVRDGTIGAVQQLSQKNGK